MNTEQSILTFALLAVIVACIAGKGCNDSDNERLKKAFESGCSVMNYGGSNQYECGQRK